MDKFLTYRQKYSKILLIVLALLVGVVIITKYLRKEQLPSDGSPSFTGEICDWIKLEAVQARFCLDKRLVKNYSVEYFDWRDLKITDLQKAGVRIKTKDYKESGEIVAGSSSWRNFKVVSGIDLSFVADFNSGAKNFEDLKTLYLKVFYEPHDEFPPQKGWKVGKINDLEYVYSLKINDSESMSKGLEAETHFLNNGVEYELSISASSKSISEKSFLLFYETVLKSLQFNLGMSPIKPHGQLIEVAGYVELVPSARPLGPNNPQVYHLWIDVKRGMGGERVILEAEDKGLLDKAVSLYSEKLVKVEGYYDPNKKALNVVSIKEVSETDWAFQWQEIRINVNPPNTVTVNWYQNTHEIGFNEIVREERVGFEVSLYLQLDINGKEHQFNNIERKNFITETVKEENGMGVTYQVVGYDQNTIILRARQWAIPPAVISRYHQPLVTYKNQKNTDYQIIDAAILKTEESNEGAIKLCLSASEKIMGLGPLTFRDACLKNVALEIVRHNYSNYNEAVRTCKIINTQTSVDPCFARITGNLIWSNVNLAQQQNKDGQLCSLISENKDRNSCERSLELRLQAEVCYHVLPDDDEREKQAECFTKFAIQLKKETGNEEVVKGICDQTYYENLRSKCLKSLESTN